MKKSISLFVFFLFSFLYLSAQDAVRYKQENDVSYIAVSETDNYRKERCKLDIYYPENKSDYATIVWFHGGGLEGGSKEIPNELKDKGIAVVAVNYRLYPNAKSPSYIDDAAESVAWVFNNIESYGGDRNQIYVAGHSAGGYLTLMVGLDKSYLQKYNIDADKIKGLIPVSGQTNTHYTIRKERGIPMGIPLVDEYAPLNQARADIPPTLLITGDRHLEMTARYEENAHLEVVLKSLGNKKITLYELQGFNHGTVYTPACFLMLEWIKNNSSN